VLKAGPAGGRLRRPSSAGGRCKGSTIFGGRVETPAIHINTAPAEVIAELYDVGPTLAERIVKHRENLGYFEGPEDLARVEGINLSLAITLAPHINWRPPTRESHEKNRDWLLGIVLLGSTVPMAAFLAEGISRLPYGGPRFQLGAPSKWVLVLVMLSIVIFLGSLMASVLLHALSAITSSQRFAASLVRPRRYLSILSVLGLVTTLIGYAIRYRMSSLSSWTHYSNDQPGLLLAGLAFIDLMWIGMLIVAYLRPSFISKPWLMNTVNYVALAIPLMLVCSIRVYYTILPNWLLVLAGLQGIFLMYIALQSIRDGDSFLEAISEVVPRSATTADDTAWITWINSRLPNATHQQALSRALTKRYPPSRAKTLLSIVIFTAGGWLVLTVIAALIQGYIQIRWLEPLLR
jgi:hypothetical protein